MKPKKNLLLLHGALSDKNQFDELIPMLEEVYAVHAISFPGHGTEPLRNYHFSIESFSAFVHEYIIEHSLSQPLIFGYSMGGYVGLYLASKIPDAVCGVVTLGTKVDWTVENAAKEVRQLNPDKIIEKVPKFAERLSKIHGSDNWREVVVRTGQLMTELGNNSLHENDYKNIEVPVIVIIGDKDSMVDLNSSKSSCELILDSRFVVLQNTEHPFEKADLSLLADILNNF